MTTFSQTGISPTSQSPASSSLPNPPDIAKDVAERITKVQEAMNDLLALYEAPSLHAKSTAIAGTLNTQGNLPAQRAEGEMRCYYFSPSALKQERLLLGKYGANDLRDLIAEAHMLLVGLVKVMKSTHPDARLRGYAVSSLGTLLEQASTLMLRMRNVYGTIEHIRP